MTPGSLLGASRSSHVLETPNEYYVPSDQPEVQIRVREIATATKPPSQMEQRRPYGKRISMQLDSIATLRRQSITTSMPQMGCNSGFSVTRAPFEELPSDLKLKVRPSQQLVRQETQLR